MAHRSPQSGRFISNAAYARWYAPGAPLADQAAPDTTPADTAPPDGPDETPIFDDGFGDNEEGWDDIPYFDEDEFQEEVLDSEEDKYSED